jgi:hypothetical protein
MQLELTTSQGEVELVMLKGEAISHTQAGFSEH